MNAADRRRVLTAIACCLNDDSNAGLLVDEDLVPMEARSDDTGLNVTLHSISNDEHIRVRLALVDDEQQS